MSSFDYSRRENIKFLVMIVVLGVWQFFQSISDYYTAGSGNVVHVVVLLRFFQIALYTVAYVLYDKKIFVRDKWDGFIIFITALGCINYYFIHDIRFEFSPMTEISISPFMGVIYIWLYALTVPFYRLKSQLAALSALAAVLLFFVDWRNVLTVQDYVFVMVSCVVAGVSGIYLVYQEKKAYIMLQAAIEEQANTNVQLQRALSEQQQARKREMELLTDKANFLVLCAQIKPHFLFNVIGTAATLCRVKPAVAEFMLNQLAVYLRNIVNVQREFVTLKEELKVTAAYLDIQKIRMEERLTYEISAGELPDVNIPVFTILTLVENAVLHGLRDKEDNGLVLIKIECNANKTRISVSDNGAGIDKERLMEIRSVLNEENLGNRRFIGLYNIQRRLLLSGNAGLEFFSYTDKGTTVSFEIAG